jgi:nicotinamide mononucleotide (NMN) deamidase PncC
MALASAQKPTVVEEHHFPSDREHFKNLTSQYALDLLRRRLEE